MVLQRNAPAARKKPALDRDKSPEETHSDCRFPAEAKRLGDASSIWTPFIHSIRTGGGRIPKTRMVGKCPKKVNPCREEFLHVNFRALGQ